nr:hypothetical protein GCM10025732_46280 [Glycomyces mayteni]
MHDRHVGEELAGVRGEDGAAAEGEDPVVLGHGPADRFAFERAEVLLAVVHEDVGDRLPGGGDDVGVGVAECRAERLGQRAADGGLAGAGRPDDHDEAHAHFTRRLSR